MANTIAAQDHSVPISYAADRVEFVTEGKHTQNPSLHPQSHLSGSVCASKANNEFENGELTVFTKTTTLSPVGRVVKKAAFTLAEVLITLVIVGVVAALTLPTLITTINSKVERNQKEVIEKKLVEGLNLLNSQENGLSHSYESTKDFVEALSKHMKLVKICSKDNLRECFPYDEIFIVEENKGVKVSNLKSSGNLQLTDKGFKDTAGFVTANGIPFIVSYKQDCVEDPDKPMESISSCVAGIYDINGSRTPNKFGYETNKDGTFSSTSDIVGFNGARLSRCVIKAGAVCIAIEPFKTEAINGNYWSYAEKKCKDAGLRLPTTSELKKIGALLYDKDEDNTLIINHARAKSLGLIAAYPGTCNTAPPKVYGLWSSEAGKTNNYLKLYLILRENSYDIANYSCSISPARGYWQGICVSD